MHASQVVKGKQLNRRNTEEKRGKLLKCSCFQFVMTRGTRMRMKANLCKVVEGVRCAAPGVLASKQEIYISCFAVRRIS